MSSFDVKVTSPIVPRGPFHPEIAQALLAAV
jgi:hypothetical protein